MLIDVNRYKMSLKKLWADTFGDNEEYIGLLFDCGYTPTESFAEIEAGEVISVLYLLGCRIKANDRFFEGRYLYAAATAENHRGKGLMGKLIGEAQKYITDKNLSFISLVPADEGLYGYYAKFGFEPIMSNFLSVSDDIGLMPEGKIAVADDYFALRKLLDKPNFTFDDENWKYALSCLRHADYDFMQNTDDSYYIISADRTEVLEYISSEENFNENTEIFLSRLDEGTAIVSPYDLSAFCECKKNKFGMVYIADAVMNDMIKDDIYMNIALD